MESDSAPARLRFVMHDGSEIFAGRVLIFNGAINIYEEASDDFKGSMPLRDVTAEEQASGLVLRSKSTLQSLTVAGGHPLEKQLRVALAHQQRGWFQKLVRHPASLWLILFAVFIVGLYMALISLVPYFGSRLINTETEIRIGRELKMVSLEQERLAGNMVDSQATIHLQRFTKLLNLSTTYPINVTVVKSDQVNAYAIPGGEIVVYSGIIEKMRNYGALAALLSHEAAHITERHTLRSMLRRTANSIAFAVLLGDIAGVTGSLGADVSSLYGLTYSRALETEADATGLKLMTKNNVHPSGMKDLMQLLSEQAPAEGVEFLSTHPLNHQRIQSVDKYLRSHAAPIAERKDLDSAFKQLKSSVQNRETRQW